MVKWTDHAKAQLRHIHDYIAQDSPLYAKRVSEELVRKTIGLDTAHQFFTDTLGVEGGVLGDVIMNMTKLGLGVVRPLHHV
jgi:hypothetical protein